ncbi:hypothetical protein PR202_ga20321 [Eleusine coracana subsp. coracana]|uniref:Uncharacterized protein n=1 Tax=Eleusine coracana subsp. coracana TaxID=191504 RepID=A0AAV5CXQ9_ELECO|nr:hypothetical protein PR202_ga20321 [Eleusine coracana subsp. coracana]
MNRKWSADCKPGPGSGTYGRNAKPPPAAEAQQTCIVVEDSVAQSPVFYAAVGAVSEVQGLRQFPATRPLSLHSVRSGEGVLDGKGS